MIVRKLILTKPYIHELIHKIPQCETFTKRKELLNNEGKNSVMQKLLEQFFRKIWMPERKICLMNKVEILALHMQKD